MMSRGKIDRVEFSPAGGRGFGNESVSRTTAKMRVLGRANRFFRRVYPIPLHQSVQAWEFCKNV